MYTFEQTEIQLIVGSRYHELIESADSVVRGTCWHASISTDRPRLPIPRLMPACNHDRPIQSNPTTQVSMYRSCKRLGLVLQELPPRFETVRFFWGGGLRLG